MEYGLLSNYLARRRRIKDTLVMIGVLFFLLIFLGSIVTGLILPLCGVYELTDTQRILILLIPFFGWIVISGGLHYIFDSIDIQTMIYIRDNCPPLLYDLVMCEWIANDR